MNPEARRDEADAWQEARDDFHPGDVLDHEELAEYRKARQHRAAMRNIRDRRDHEIARNRSTEDDPF